MPAAISAGTVPAAQASAALAAIGRAREKSRTAEVRLIGADAPAAADAVTGADTAVSFPLDQFAKQNGADAAVQTAGGVVNVHAVFQMDAQTRELTVAIVSEPARGPRIMASRLPPIRWPEVPPRTGKFSICAAKTKAARTPMTGTMRPDRSTFARLAIYRIPAPEIRSSETATRFVKKPSGMCIGEF